jgi:NAD(P)H-dependent flavin oxidoreductase YrpB (nitropropane dioxygenase family)
MIANSHLDKLIQASQIGLLARALKNGLAFNRMQGGSLMATLGGAWKMYRSGDLSFGQTLMAANAPMMIQEAMVKGKPHAGILPSGQVAGLIEDLPSVSDLIESIVDEAQQSADRISQMVVPPENNQ